MTARRAALNKIYWYIVNNAGRREKSEYLDALKVLSYPITDLETEWIETADRMPTENDGYVIAVSRATFNNGFVPVALWYVTVNKTMHPYWMPLPPLPVNTKGEMHD